MFVICTDGDEQSLFYSTFAPDGIFSSPGGDHGDQCLTARLTSGLHWNQVHCDSPLTHVICQSKLIW